MYSFASLPSELILHSVLPHLSARDLLTLGCTNRELNQLTNDGLLWKNRCESEFATRKLALPVDYMTSKSFSWKRLYRKLAHPIMFGWGIRSPGLAVPGFERVSRPVMLPSIPGAGITKLIAGGWSMHALDTQRRIHVLGALDGSNDPLARCGFENPHQRAHPFYLLMLPAKFTTMSCGIINTVALDSSGNAWDFTTWARPAKIAPLELDTSSPDTAIVRAACGRRCRALLLRSGTVYMWWSTAPMMEELPATFAETVSIGSSQDESSFVKALNCEPTEHEPTFWTLPGLPGDILGSVNKPSNDNLSQTTECLSIKVVNIAFVGLSLLGLTNNGCVLLIRNSEGPSLMRNSTWEYLPEFSEAKRIRLSLLDGGVADHKDDTDLVMTDIASNTNTVRFILYRPARSPSSFSTVLCGRTTAGAVLKPSIIPLLQQIPIATISMGDWHMLALTADGRVLAWGNDIQGSLGVGDSMPRGDTPVEVQFPGPTRVFCIGVTAMGWHSGVLAIHLEDEEDDAT